MLLENISLVETWKTLAKEQELSYSFFPFQVGI
jgi:hypothetical protein